MKQMYILALAALAMAFSCQKTENTLEVTSEPVVRTFTCTFADTDTKLAINDASGKTTWEVGDEILIRGRWTGKSGSNYYSRVVTLTSENIKDAGKTASFEVEEIYSISSGSRWQKGNTQLFAVYPASAVVINNGSTNWNENTPFNTTNTQLVAGYNDVTVNDGNSFTMYNLCGIISFKVTGDYDSYTFVGNDAETVGYEDYKAALYMGSADPSLTWVSGGSALTSISGPITGDGSTVNYICLPNGASFTGGFTVNFFKSGSIIKTLSTTKPVTVSRNEYRPMGDVTAYLKDYVAPSTHDSAISTTGATALDASGNANCYIVDGSVAANAEKVFTFKAYKGNSTAGVGTVAKAELLWETWNNAETVTENSVIAAVDFEKKAENDYYTMVFKMPATLHAGNALIAAKDAGDNILWSWHIWVPETSVEDINDAAFFGKVVMDRNLGAIEKARSSAAGRETYGMYYQWGRSTPLPGPVKATATITATNGPKSTAFAIANPTVFIQVPEKDENGNWNEEDLPNLWEDGDKNKEIFDPCPSGYKVPSYSSSTGLWVNGNDGWTYNWTNNNFAYGSIVFPMAGWYSSGASISYEGARSIILSATAHSAPRARLKIIRQDKSGYYYANYFKEEAASVRCVAE